MGSVPGLGRYPGEGNCNLLQYPAGKESACSVGDLGSIPGQGRSPGEGNSYPLQYSGLENSMDCIVHGVAKNQTGLSNFHFTSLHFNSVLLPGKFHGRRSLDMTECTHTHTHTHTHTVISSFIHSGSNCTLNSLLVQPSAAAAAKSLQSCPTLWDPIDGSPPGSPIPGILQARTLEWVAIAFSRFNLLIRA